MKKLSVYRVLIFIPILLGLFWGTMRAEAETLQNPLTLPTLAAKQFDGRDLKTVKVLEDNKAYTRYLINYKSGNLNISGIMNVPKGEGPFPVLILNHGHINPEIYTVGRGLKREQDYLARRGFVVIHPDYRNHGLSDKDPQSELSFNLNYVEDVINVIMAVKASRYAFLDKEKIGMLGHSLGGGIALNILVTKPDLVKACALYAPMSGNYINNFNRWIKRGHHGVAEKILARYGSPESNPIFWKEISAINYLDKIKAPILLNHGTADKSVPIAWSNELDQLLREKGKAVVYYQYPGEGHEFERAWPLFMQRSAEFFSKNLKP